MHSPHITRLTGLVLATLLARVAPVQGTAAQPDVWLAKLTVAGAKVTLGPPLNITARPGYDNQPSFSPDGRTIYYTSVREDRQADIYRYDRLTRQTSRVTVTNPESEYSAAVIPGTRDLAVIRVERDSTQRLWRFPLRLAGTKDSLGTVLLERVKPAGYFAFADARRVALFVLGSPNSLQLADVTTGRADTLLARVGRSLHRIPGKAAISVVSHAYVENTWLLSLDLATRHLVPLARLPDQVEDYAWLPDGRLIAGQGSKLLVCDPATDAVWREVADLTGAGVTGITRLAVAPRGDWLAIVGIPR